MLNYSSAARADIDAVVPLNMAGSRTYPSNTRVLDATHPVTEGLPTSFYHRSGETSTSGADAGAEVLADDGAGAPTVIVSEETGDRAAWLSPPYFYGYSETTTPAADQLLEQSVNWAAGGGTDRADYFSVLANPGDILILSTATPGDGPSEPANDLDPLLELYDPGGTLVASNNDDPNGDGHNARIEYPVPTDGGGMYGHRRDVRRRDV